MEVDNRKSFVCFRLKPCFVNLDLHFASRRVRDLSKSLHFDNFNIKVNPWSQSQSSSTAVMAAIRRDRSRPISNTFFGKFYMNKDKVMIYSKQVGLQNKL